MGGDEVLPMCWNEIPGIYQWMQNQKINSHVELWGQFHSKGNRYPYSPYIRMLKTYA